MSAKRSSPARPSVRWPRGTFGARAALTGCLIPPAFARGDAERYHETTTLHRAAFRVGAQVAYELRLVQISGHDLIPSFTPLRERRRFGVITHRFPVLLLPVLIRFMR